MGTEATILRLEHKEVSTDDSHSTHSFPKAVAFVTVLVLGPLIVIFICLFWLYSTVCRILVP